MSVAVSHSGISCSLFAASFGRQFTAARIRTVPFRFFGGRVLRRFPSVAVVRHLSSGRSVSVVFSFCVAEGSVAVLAAVGAPYGKFLPRGGVLVAPARSVRWLR